MWSLGRMPKAVLLKHSGPSATLVNILSKYFCECDMGGIDQKLPLLGGQNKRGTVTVMATVTNDLINNKFLFPVS
jgi:hypothetical protein